MVEKGEIARYKQILLFPQCFQKACFPGASNGVIVWEWVKGEIDPYEQFLLFPVFSKGLFPRGIKRCRCVGMG